MAAVTQTPAIVDDDARGAREPYLPPLPAMGSIDRQFLTLFWGARFPVLVAPPEPPEFHP
jgi:hypothetical protein